MTFEQIYNQMQWTRELYACSPEESSFTALFSDMRITACTWQAHDGLQPD